MKKTPLLLLLLISFFCKVKAQETYSLKDDLLVNYHPFYQTKSLFLANNYLPKQYANATLNTFVGENNNKHPFMPKNYNGFTLTSTGFKQLKKKHIYGKISFNEQYNNKELGKNVFPTSYLSPYYISDSLQKNWKWQYINATTIISNPISKKLHTELGVNYIAQHKVNYQLPKPLLYKNTFTIQPTLGYKINKTHKIAISYRFKNSNTTISIDDGSVSQVQLFSITGIGNLTNNKGFGSSYRYQNETANQISMKGIGNIADKNEFLYCVSIEKMQQQGFDDNLKQKQIFNYNEWISSLNTQLKTDFITDELFINYTIKYQNGKGTHQQPKVNYTFTEKLFQELQLLLYQTKQKQIYGLYLKHTHLREANTIFGNFYDFDYLSIATSFKKEIPFGVNYLLLYTKLEYQTPTHRKNRFVKTNHYITNFIVPFTKFYHQNFYTIQLKPELFFSVKSLKSEFNIGINSQFVITNTINFYNGLFVKSSF